MNPSLRGALSRLASAAGIAALVLAASAVTAQQPDVEQVPEIAAGQWFMMDHASGNVLAESGAADRFPPGDFVKLMTAYAVLDAIGKGRVTFDDQVTISDAAWRTPGARMYVEPDSQVPLEALLRGVIVQASNDASVALAEHVAGSEQAFVAEMNAHAAVLGLEGTAYVDSTGAASAGQHTTVRDTALLARVLIQRFPDTYAWYREREFTYNDITRHNDNALLWRDPTVDGLKAAQAGPQSFGLVSSADRGGARLIVVVMGAADDSARIAASEALLEHGFRSFETHKLYSAGVEIAVLRVWQGAGDGVPVGVTEDLHVTIPRGRYGDLTADMRPIVPLRAPVEAGAPAGVVELSLGGEPFATAPVVTLEEVHAGGLWKRLADRIALWWQ